MPFAKDARPSKFSYWSRDVVTECKEKLLPHQYEALTSLRKWFCERNDKRRALVSMPTGSGKTGVICCLPYFLAEKKPEKNDKKVCFDKPILVIAPNLDISTQLEQQILVSADGHEKNFLLRREIVPIKNQRDVLPSGIKVEKTAEVSKQEYLRNKEVVIANAQKFLEDSWEENLSDDLFEMVIVDEAHHFPAETWSKIIRKFEAHALVVFFTATPFRSDDKTVVEPPFAYHLSLGKARDNRIIRQTEWVELPEDQVEPDDPNNHEQHDDPNNHEQHDDPNNHEQHDDPNNHEQHDDPNNHEQHDDPVRMILKKVKHVQDTKNEKQPLPDNVPHMAIAICKSKEAANDAVNMWNTLFDDHSAVGFHSGMRKRQLQQMKKRIENNEVKLVVVVEMLQEGFDHPPISIAAIMTKIVSPVKFVQFIGRAQRVVRRGGGQEAPDIHADIITHIHYQQKENYFKFENGHFIDIGEA